MRRSSPMPRATSSIVAPTTSHTFATSLMNEILVARNAFEASLIISDEVTSVRTMCSAIGSYRAAMRLDDRRVVGADHHAVRLGEVAHRRPSRRNSGFDA